MNKLLNSPTKDLFDDSTMSFGEHLEVLRRHLIRAIFWLVLAVCITLLFGEPIVKFISKPINEALIEYGLQGTVADDITGFDFWRWLKTQAGLRTTPLPEPIVEPTPTTIAVSVPPAELAAALHRYDAKRFPTLAADPKAEPLILHLTQPAV